jgi:CBS domain-containing protein
MNCCISETYTIKEAMSIFEEDNERSVIVINATNKVIGILSEGDIIRALHENIDIYAPIKAILKPSFIYLKERNMAKAYTLFKSKKILLLPVVNDNYELMEIITLKNIFRYLEEEKK